MPTPCTQVTTLLTRFRLTTAAQELALWLTQTRHHEVMLGAAGSIRSAVSAGCLTAPGPGIARQDARDARHRTPARSSRAATADGGHRRIAPDGDHRTRVRPDARPQEPRAVRRRACGCSRPAAGHCVRRPTCCCRSYSARNATSTCRVPLREPHLVQMILLHDSVSHSEMRFSGGPAAHDAPLTFARLDVRLRVACA